MFKLHIRSFADGVTLRRFLQINSDYLTSKFYCINSVWWKFPRIGQYLVYQQNCRMTKEKMGVTILVSEIWPFLWKLWPQKNYQSLQQWVHKYKTIRERRPGPLLMTYTRITGKTRKCVFQDKLQCKCWYLQRIFRAYSNILP